MKIMLDHIFTIADIVFQKKTNKRILKSENDGPKQNPDFKIRKFFVLYRRAANTLNCIL
jgi:hypothetical protein